MPEGRNNEGTEVFRCARTRRVKAFFLFWHTCSFRANELSRNEQAKDYLLPFICRLDFFRLLIFSASYFSRYIKEKYVA